MWCVCSFHMCGSNYYRGLVRSPKTSKFLYLLPSNLVFACTHAPPLWFIGFWNSKWRSRHWTYMKFNQWVVHHATNRRNSWTWQISTMGQIRISSSIIFGFWIQFIHWETSEIPKTLHGTPASYEVQPMGDTQELSLMSYLGTKEHVWLPGQSEEWLKLIYLNWWAEK